MKASVNNHKGKSYMKEKKIIPHLVEVKQELQLFWGNPDND
jgi:hypothetical protein